MYNAIKTSMNKTFNLLKNTYTSITEENFKEIKEKFNVDNYIKKLLPIIDNQFSEKEIDEIIKFYSSPAGKKTTDPIFLKKVSQSDKSFFSEIEQEFSIQNAKNL